MPKQVQPSLYIYESIRHRISSPRNAISAISSFCVLPSKCGNNHTKRCLEDSFCISDSMHHLLFQSQSRSQKHGCQIRPELPLKSQMKLHRHVSLIRPHIPFKSQISSQKHVYQMRPLLLFNSPITSHSGGSRNRRQVPLKSEVSSQKYGSQALM